MLETNYVLVIIYTLISFFGFFFAWKSFSTGKIMLKKGIAGTSLETSRIFYYVQLVVLIVWGVTGMFFAYSALTMIE